MFCFSRKYKQSINFDVSRSHIIAYSQDTKDVRSLKYRQALTCFRSCDSQVTGPIPSNFSKTCKCINLKRFKCLKNNPTLRGKIKLSFSSRGLEKHKIKNLLALETIALQKAFFKIQKINNKRKNTFLALESHVILDSRFHDYFLYNFSKNGIGFIKNLPFFFSHLSINKQDLEIEFSKFFYDLTNKQEDKQAENLKISFKNNKIQDLGFYKIKL